MISLHDHGAATQKAPQKMRRADDRQDHRQLPKIVRMFAPAGGKSASPAIPEHG